LKYSYYKYIISREMNMLDPWCKSGV